MVVMTKLLKYVGFFSCVILTSISSNPSASYFLPPKDDRFYEQSRNSYFDTEELLDFLSDVVNEEQAQESAQRDTKRNSNSINDQADNEKWFEYLMDKRDISYQDSEYTYVPDMDVYRKEEEWKKAGKEYYNPDEDSEDGISTWNDLLLSKFLRDRDFDQRLLMTALLEDMIDNNDELRTKEKEDVEKDDELSLEEYKRMIFQSPTEKKDLKHNQDASKSESKVDEDPNLRPSLGQEGDESDVTSDGKKQRGKETEITEEMMADGTTGDNEHKRNDAQELVEAGEGKSQDDNTLTYSQKDVDDLKSLLTDVSTTQPPRHDTSQENIIDVMVPGVTIQEDDTYLCSATKIPTNNVSFIVEYIPHANQSVAHHMLLFGCHDPGKHNTAVWSCSQEMSSASEKNTQYPSGRICGGYSSTILWAWAKDAPTFKLPKDVGFKVGPGTNINYFVLQVHYKSASEFKGGMKDYSGVEVLTTEKQKPKLAGVYIMVTNKGTVKPHQFQKMDIQCRYNQNFDIHPFAFRTHTHALGKKVMGYRVRDGEWTLIGEKNPQRPQAFYPVANENMTITRGDWLASSCIMYNFRDRPTSIGWRHTDEMCNFYMMFWVPSSKELLMKSWWKECSGYPWMRWSQIPEE